MAKPRQIASGNWQIALRHPSLPGGRNYFLFDTDADARNASLTEESASPTTSADEAPVAKPSLFK
jgi:hypothetical protein